MIFNVSSLVKEGGSNGLVVYTLLSAVLFNIDCSQNVASCRDQF